MAKVGDKIRLTATGVDSVDEDLKYDLRDEYTLAEHKSLFGGAIEFWKTAEPIGEYPGLLLLDDEFEVID